MYLLFRAPSLSDEAVTANSTNELRCWSNYCSRSTTSAVKSGSGSRLRNMVARALTPERGSLEPSSEKSEVRRQERVAALGNSRNGRDQPSSALRLKPFSLRSLTETVRAPSAGAADKSSSFF